MRSYTYRIGYDLTGRRALSLAQELARIPIAEIDALILTLAEVKTIDASGLAVLVRLYSHLMRSKKFLVLKEFSPEVEGILRRVGLESVLVEAEEPSALRDPARHRPWTPADSRLPSRMGRSKQEKHVPSIDDVVDALARLDSSQAMSFLNRVQAKLGLTPAEPLPAVPETPPPAESAAPSREAEARRAAASQPFSPVQSQVLRTGKRRKAAYDGKIVEPARSASGNYSAVEETEPPVAADPSPVEDLPEDVESLLLDYLGKANRGRRRAGNGAGGVKAPPAASPKADPIKAGLPKEPVLPEPKRADPLPAGVRALLSDYLSHEDSSTLGPWASASGIN